MRFFTVVVMLISTVAAVSGEELSADCRFEADYLDMQIFDAKQELSLLSKLPAPTAGKFPDEVRQAVEAAIEARSALIAPFVQYIQSLEDAAYQFRLCSRTRPDANP